MGGPVGHQGMQTAGSPWRGAAARKLATQLGGSPTRRTPAIRVGPPSAARHDPRPTLRGGTPKCPLREEVDQRPLMSVCIP